MPTAMIAVGASPIEIARKFAMREEEGRERAHDRDDQDDDGQQRQLAHRDQPSNAVGSGAARLGLRVSVGTLVMRRVPHRARRARRRAP